jgi:hypothetical protein
VPVTDPGAGRLEPRRPTHMPVPECSELSPCGEITRAEVNSESRAVSAGVNVQAAPLTFFTRIIESP